MRAGAENVHAQVLEAADLPAAGPVDQVDNQKYQSVLGSTIKWEWEDDLRAVRSMEPTGHLDARLEVLLDDPRLYQPSASINGCETLSVFSDKLNVKRAGGAPFPWHQEGLYWENGAEDLESLVSTLTYLDDARAARPLAGSRSAARRRLPLSGSRRLAAATRRPRRDLRRGPHDGGGAVRPADEGERPVRRLCGSRRGQLRDGRQPDLD